MNRRWITFAALVVLVSGTVAAETAPTLEEELSAAADNPEIAAARAAAEEARAALKEGRSRRGPRIDQYTQYSISDDKVTQLPDANQIVIRADQSVFEPSLSADLRRLSALSRAADAAAVQKEADVMLEVRRVFFRAASAERRANALQEAESEFASVLKLISPRYTIGSVPEYDYATIRFMIAQYRQNRLEAAADRSHQLRQLGALTNRPTPTGVAPPADPVLPAETPGAGDTELILANRADIRASEENAAAAEAEVGAARRGRWPVLHTSADAGDSGQKADGMALGWGFTATATVPLFDSGSATARIHQALARQDQRQRDADNVKRRAINDLEDFRDAAGMAWDRLRVTRELLPEGRKAYESSLRRYRSGLAQMTELNDAHDLWVQARLRAIDAELDYRLAAAQLTAARGTSRGAP